MSAAFWLILFVVSLICGAIAGGIAESKGRVGAGWAFLGFFFGPLGVLASAMTSPIREPAANASIPAEPGNNAAMGSVADELSKLGDLKDRGLLTNDEFEVQKAKLLA